MNIGNVETKIRKLISISNKEAHSLILIDFIIIIMNLKKTTLKIFTSSLNNLDA